MLALIAANVLRRPARTILSATGVAVGVASIVALLSFTQGLKDTAAGFVHLGGSDLGVFQSQASDPTTSVLPATATQRLRAIPGVARATPLLLLSESVKGQESAIVFGADPGGFFTRGLVVLSGHMGAGGAHEAMIGDRLAASLRLHPGGTLQIKGTPFAVVGVYHSGILFEDAGAVLGLQAAQQLAGRSEEVTDVVVGLAAGTRASAEGPRIERALPGTRVISDPQQALRAGANATLISKAVLVIVVIALIVGAISVANTVAISIVERQSEIALLTAVGFSPGRVAVTVLGEGVAVSFLGAAAGLLFGVVGAGLLVHALGVSGYVSPTVTAWGLGRGLLVGVAIGVLGGLYPALRVTRMTPLRVLSTQ